MLQVTSKLSLLMDFLAEAEQRTALRSGLRLSPEGELLDADGTVINELGATRFDVAAHGKACCPAVPVLADLTNFALTPRLMRST